MGTGKMVRGSVTLYDAWQMLIESEDVRGVAITALVVLRPWA